MERLKAYKGKGKYIFVSYSHKDGERAFSIIKAMQERFNVWFDEGIYLGEDYRKVIIEKINGCALFVYLVSLESLSSSFCKKEIRQAERKNRPFFNVIMDEKVLEAEEAESFFFDYDDLQRYPLYERSVSEFVNELEAKAPKALEAKRDEKSHPEKVMPTKGNESLALLDGEQRTDEKEEANRQDAERNRLSIDDFFLDIPYGARVEEYEVGRAYTRYSLKLGAKSKVKEIGKYVIGLQEKLQKKSIFLSQTKEEGKPYLEIANAIIREFPFRESLSLLPEPIAHPYAIPFGINGDDELIWDELTDLPHLLVVGMDGVGKSSFLDSILLTLVYRLPPSYLRLVIAGSKTNAFSSYRGLPHLLTPVVHDATTTKTVLRSLIRIQNERLDILLDSGVSSVNEYNVWMRAKGEDGLPLIVVVLDDYCHLLSECNEIRNYVFTLLQKGRPSGIHLILSSLRADVGLMGKTTMENIGTKVAFHCKNAIDSMAVLGQVGAEKLLVDCDMLLSSSRGQKDVLHLQSSYVTTKDADMITGEAKSLYELSYDDSFLYELKEEATISKDYPLEPEINVKARQEDPLYEKVRQWAKEQDYVSISKIQREMGIGFNRASAYLEALEEEGIIEPMLSNEPPSIFGRKVIRKG